MAEFTFEGKQIYYELHGEGRPLLLLNGIMMSCRSWAEFVQPLSAQNQLILLDMLDQGRSAKMTEPYDHSVQIRLVDALLDGTIDMIATDHAPHSAEEKSRGLEGSAFGITGLETAFPVLWTGLVEPGILSRERLIELMSTAPARRFGRPGSCFIPLSPPRRRGAFAAES